MNDGIWSKRKNTFGKGIKGVSFPKLGYLTTNTTLTHHHFHFLTTMGWFDDNSDQRQAYETVCSQFHVCQYRILIHAIDAPPAATKGDSKTSWSRMVSRAYRWWVTLPDYGLDRLPRRPHDTLVPNRWLFSVVSLGAASYEAAKASDPL